MRCQNYGKIIAHLWWNERLRWYLDTETFVYLAHEGRWRVSGSLGRNLKCWTSIMNWMYCTLYRYTYVYVLRNIQFTLVRHFGTLPHFVRHYVISKYEIRHSGSNSVALLLHTQPAPRFVVSSTYPTRKSVAWALFLHSEHLLFQWKVNFCYHLGLWNILTSNIFRQFTVSIYAAYCYQ